MKRRIVMVVVFLLLAACSQEPTPAAPQQPTTQPPTTEQPAPESAEEAAEAQAEAEAEAEISATLPPNTWRKLGGALDSVLKNNAVKPKALLDRNGKFVVVWAEDNGLWYLQAKRWTGSAWEKLNLPAKALPYTDAGVNDFDVAVDSTNTLVVSEQDNLGNVSVYRNTGPSWQHLGGYDLTDVPLETDPSGNIYGLRNPFGTLYDIMKWNGSAWVKVATFDNNWCVTPDCADSPDFSATKVISFRIQSDGKPVVATAEGDDATTFYAWDGKRWGEVATLGDRYPTNWQYSLQAYGVGANNQLVYAYNKARGGQFMTDETYISSNSKTFFTAEAATVYDIALRNNIPFALYRVGYQGGTLLSSGFYDTTTNAWKKVAGRLERDANKVASQSSLLADKNGNTFVIWQEAKCEASATCGGANIYVSQYVQ